MSVEQPNLTIKVDVCDEEDIGQSSSPSSRKSSHEHNSITDKEDTNLLAPCSLLSLRKSSQSKERGSQIGDSSRSSSMCVVQEFELEKQLDQYHLELLLSKFTPKQKKEGENEKIVTYMDMKLFRKTIVELFSGDLSMEYFNKKILVKNADLFFKKVDWQNNGKIMWDDICSYLLMDLKTELLNQHDIFVCEPRIVQFRSIKDTIVKIMPDGNSSRFVQIARNGLVNILSSNLQIKKSYKIEDCTDGLNSRNPKSKVWVTDSICVSNINKLFITTANRDLKVYDMATPHFSQLFNLYDIPNAAMCMEHHYIRSHPYGKCYLFLGTDSGNIHLFTFLQPSKSLFEKPFKKSSAPCNILYWDLHTHSAYVSHRCISRVHSDWVRRIMYVPDGDLLFSCSTNLYDSLIYQSLHQTGRKVYHFKVMKGVDCFDYSKEMNLIATGSVDHVVRLWDPYSTARPMAILKFHESAVIDLIIYEPACQVFSYSKDGHLCCWDTKEYICLQKILIKFPQIGRASFDHGTRSIYMFDDSLMKLLITGEHCVGELQLSCGSSRKALSQVAHDREVVSALCNLQKEQVVSVSESGEIILWSVTTGKKFFTIQEPKLTGEVSAVAIDVSGEYLVTGSRNGSGALWNLTTATCEKQLEAYSNEEITCLLILPGKKTVFMFGWSRKILAYYHSHVTSILKPDTSWLRVNPHKDDILSAVYCAPQFIATSSFDGSIHIWQIESQRLWTVIQPGSPVDLKSNLLDPRLLRNSSRSSRKSARRRSSSVNLSKSSNDMSGVDILLYLQKRNSELEAPLVAIEGNLVKFWCTLNNGNPVASFVVGSKPDSFITAAASDMENKYLCTAEKYGSIFVWEIEGYAVGSKMKKSSVHKKYSTCQQTPPLSTSWLAHNDEITSLSCIHCRNNIYIVSASVDYRIKLWTIQGIFIGKFSSESSWSLTQQKLDKLPNCKRKVKRLSESTDSPVRNTRGTSFSEDVLESEREEEEEEEEVEEVEEAEEEEEEEDSSHSNVPTLPQIHSDSGGNSPFISEITIDVGRIKSCESYKATSKIMEDINVQKDSWGSLGLLYKNEVNRRMEGRANRRLLLRDDRLLSQADVGVSCLCLPFKALITYETEEYIMPVNPLKSSRKPVNSTNI